MNDAELMSAVVVAIVVAFYFMFMRPANKAREQHKQQMRDLRAGDRVLTTSNFIATVRDIQVQEKGPSRITLEIAPGIIVTALPAAILERIDSSAADAASTDKGPSTAQGRL